MKKIVFGFIAVLVLAVGGFAVYTYFFSDEESDDALNNEMITSENTEAEESEDEELYTLEPVDAEEYLEEIGEIRKIYSVDSSESIQTEEKLVDMLSERGFDQYDVETNYSMDGEYYDSKVVSDDSTEEHPIYETYFVSADESMWSIEIVNGSIYASPFSYNLEEDLQVPVILSETEYITFYDSATNQFFEVIPDSSEMIVKVVTKIDAEMLEGFTTEEIDK
jgi:hypothetical protein